MDGWADEKRRYFLKSYSRGKFLGFHLEPSKKEFGKFTTKVSIKDCDSSEAGELWSSSDLSILLSQFKEMQEVNIVFDYSFRYGSARLESITPVQVAKQDSTGAK